MVKKLIPYISFLILKMRSVNDVIIKIRTFKNIITVESSHNFANDETSFYAFIDSIMYCYIHELDIDIGVPNLKYTEKEYNKLEFILPIDIPSKKDRKIIIENIKRHLSNEFKILKYE